MTRFLLLHSKSDSPEEITRQVELARTLLTACSHGKLFEITTGRDFHAERFKECGSWNAWAEEAGAGVHYLTREPLFHSYLVPSVYIGAGTARVLGYALAAGKRAFAFSEDGIASVRTVVRMNREDWKTGWTVIVGPYVRYVAGKGETRV